MFLVTHPPRKKEPPRTPVAAASVCCRRIEGDARTFACAICYGVYMGALALVVGYGLTGNIATSCMGRYMLVTGFDSLDPH